MGFRGSVRLYIQVCALILKTCFSAALGVAHRCTAIDVASLWLESGVSS